MTERNKTAGGARLFAWLTVILALAAAVLRTVMLAKWYDPVRFVYALDARPAVLLDWITGIVVVLLVIAAAILFRTNAVEGDQKVGGFSAFASFLCGLMMAAVGLWYFIGGLIRHTIVLRSAESWLTLAAAVSALVAAIYFIALALGKPLYRKNACAVIFFVILWAMFTLMASYFSFATPMTSPTRIYNQVALLAAMLAFVNEARVLVGRPAPGRLAAFDGAAVILLAGSAVPSVILALVNGWNMTESLLTFALRLSLALFLAARLFDRSRE